MYIHFFYNTHLFVIIYKIRLYNHLYWSYVSIFSKTPQPVDLWSEPSGLGIFETDKLEEFTAGPCLSTWAQLHAKDLKLSITHPPSNIYEQMILWTNQGKLWHFPIDNEQGKNFLFSYLWFFSIWEVAGHYEMGTWLTACTTYVWVELLEEKKIRRYPMQMLPTKNVTITQISDI